MYKKLLLILILAISVVACKKNKNSNGCGTGVCTANFVVIGFAFTDAAGQPTAIKNITVINVRTGKPVPPTSFASTANLVPGAIIVATDETKSSFSAEGDDIRITAASVATGQTKQAVIKISGGCNCHAAKVSGAETIKFD